LQVSALEQRREKKSEFVADQDISHAQQAALPAPLAIADGSPQTPIPSPPTATPSPTPVSTHPVPQRRAAGASAIAPEAPRAAHAAASGSAADPKATAEAKSLGAAPVAGNAATPDVTAKPDAAPSTAGPTEARKCIFWFNPFAFANMHLQDSMPVHSKQHVM